MAAARAPAGTDFVGAAVLLGAVGVATQQLNSKARVLQRSHSRTRAARRAPAPQLTESQSSKQKSFFGLPFGQRDVPLEQQPAVEWRNLQQEPFYDWARDDERYKEKMSSLYRFLSVFASLPIAYTTYHRLPFELPQLLLSANIGTLAVMAPFVGRLRIGYGYVSERLREKSTYYEAQSRGLFAQKEPDALFRDRLTEKSQVRPALQRIDASIAAIVLGLAISTAGAEALTIIEGENGPATIKTLVGDDALRFENRLRSDPDFAAREQERALAKGNADGTGVKPVYCESRYYKIVAGGGNC
jgi:hypothetical protein